MSPRTVAVVGNPKVGSRTLDLAERVVVALTGSEPDLVIDLAGIGPALLDWKDPLVAGLVEQVSAAELVVVASPTYKATYTGLLKIFLDWFPGGTGLRGVAVPVMLGAGAEHALAAELHLAPLLRELGASVPARSLYALDGSYDDPAVLDAWLARAAPAIHAVLDQGALR